MGVGSKSVTLASAIAGAALLSQSPEIAQQYRQRLGGALEEMRTVVEEFDKDAEASSLSRDEVLKTMQQSPDQLVRDRGTSMVEAVDRFAALDQQKFQMEKAHPLTRPLFVLQYPDQKLLKGVWEDFEPAVPLTTTGAVYGGLGAILFIFFIRLGMAPFRRGQKTKKGNVPVRNLRVEEPADGVIEKPQSAPVVEIAAEDQLPNDEDRIEPPQVLTELKDIIEYKQKDLKKRKGL